jgi:hypothetical protein
MKKQQYLIFFLLFLSFQSLAMSNSVKWQDAFRESSLFNWDYQLNPKAIKLVKDPINLTNDVALFRLSDKETWPNGQTRVELKHNVINSEENATTTFEFKSLTTTLFSQKNSIVYWESENTYKQAFSFSIEPIEKKNHLVFSTNFPSTKVHFSIPLNDNEWNSITTKVTWSINADRGKLNVFVNDKKLVDELIIQTKSDQNAMFVQMGLHRNIVSASVDQIYIKDVSEK